ncbi:thrombospondin type 1 domain protein, partial [Teladorsagia circumcincta]
MRQKEQVSNTAMLEGVQAIVPVAVLHMGKALKPAYDGCGRAGCIGPALETCSVMAQCQEWAPWSAWTLCSVSCGEGERKRTRECVGGRDCPGVGMAVETCVTPTCPTWSDWGPWEGCSITCGQGHEKRSRKCQYRTRECEHGSCEGASEERLLCNQQ